MKKLPAVINNRASASSLRWTGVAIAAMQLVYVTATLISDYTTGISTPYSLTAVFVMLGTMAVLAIVNIAKVIFVPKNNVAYHCVMVAYYVSLILFSVCVYNSIGMPFWPYCGLLYCPQPAYCLAEPRTA